MCNYGSYVAVSSEKKGIEKGIQQGIIRGWIEALREMNIPEREIAEKIKAKYDLTDEEVDKGVMLPEDSKEVAVIFTSF